MMIRNNATFSVFKQIVRIHPRSNLNALHFSRCAVISSEAKTKSQAPASSRRPVESTHLEQNPHLKHATSGEKGGKGRDKAPAKSNAAEDPKLPSHKFDNGGHTNKKGDSSSNVKAGTGTHGKRGLHWSSIVRFAEGGAGDKSGHSADSYFKDVDSNEPSTTTTYTVGGDDATKAHRPNEQYADPKKQYATVSREEPYQPPTAEAEGEDGGEGGKKKNVKQSNLRYGGTEKDSERGTSHSNESAAEGSASGRKPEGRK